MAKWKVKFTDKRHKSLWMVVEDESRAAARQQVLDLSEELGWEAVVMSVAPAPVDNEDEWVYTGKTRKH